jgi:hypothetical protein
MATIAELRELARERGLEGFSQMNKADLEEFLEDNGGLPEDEPDGSEPEPEPEEERPAKAEKPKTALRARAEADGDVSIVFYRIRPDAEAPEEVGEHTKVLGVDEASELAESIPNAVGIARTQIHRAAHGA